MVLGIGDGLARPRWDEPNSSHLAPEKLVVDATLLVPAEGKVFLGEGAIALPNGRAAFVDCYCAAYFDRTEFRRELASRVFVVSVADGKVAGEFPTPDRACASAVLPTSNPGVLLVPTDLGVFLLDTNNGEWRKLAPLPGMSPGNVRTNHCTVDPQGHAWIATMGEGEHRNREGCIGALYRLDAEGTYEQLLDGLFIPNGHCFAPAEQGQFKVFYNDLGRDFCPVDARIQPTRRNRTTDIYNYDAIQNALTFAGELVTYDESRPGFADGMAIDATGKYILVPMFAGSTVHIIDVRNGSFVGEVRIPVPQVTSVAVMPGTATVVITTAAEKYTDDDFRAYPEAGGLFVADLSVFGIKGPDPAVFALR